MSVKTKPTNFEDPAFWAEVHDIGGKATVEYDKVREELEAKYPGQYAAVAADVPGRFAVAATRDEAIANVQRGDAGLRVCTFRICHS